MTHEKARIWFFTDLHGSDTCFRKFLNASKNKNKPNVLILGGDITGKQLVPLMEDRNGNILATFGHHEFKVLGSKLPQLKKQIDDRGYYSYECDERELKQFRTDQDALEAVFEKLVRQRLEKWIKLADERLPPRDVCLAIVNAGNDDPLFVDDILDKSEKLVRPEGRIVDLPCNLKLLSTGYCNDTPWKCPRDLSEVDLGKKIARMTGQLMGDQVDRLIFNMHCPPKDTALDLADKIDRRTMRRVAGPKGAVQEHVGSTAVRTSIETWQPIAGLHGHIHQVHAKDRIGRTLCFNPGSDYRSEQLQGAFLQIGPSGNIEIETLTQERDPNDARKGTEIIQSIFSEIPVVGHIVRDHAIQHGLEELRVENKEIKELLKGLGRRSSDPDG